jgi:hypothetical protein
MGEVIDFPVSAARHANKPHIAAAEDDPYYRFIRNVLMTADACGFTLPFTIESAAEHVYQKTQDTSELARLLREKS